MLRIVLPAGVAIANIGAVSTADVRVAIAIIEVVVDRDVVVAPAATPPPTTAAAAPSPECAHGHTYTETDRGGRCHGAIGICDRGICVNRRRPINDGRAIARNVNYFGVGRLNLDDRFRL